MNKRTKKKKVQNKKAGVFVRLAFLFVVFSVFFGLVASLPVFRINNVEVVGSRLVSVDEILRLSDIPIGNSLFFTNFRPAKNRIKNLPVISRIKISRKIPSTVVIKIEERRESVVAVLKGQSLILDSQGFVLNPNGVVSPGVNLPDITSLPVMNGLKPEWLEEGKYIKSKEGKDVLSLLGQFSDFVVPQKLQIDISSLENINLLVDDILKVKIGDSSLLKEKMKIFELIYSKMRDKKNNIEYVDVSSIKFPVAKFR